MYVIFWVLGFVSPLISFFFCQYLHVPTLSVSRIIQSISLGGSPDIYNFNISTAVFDFSCSSEVVLSYLFFHLFSWLCPLLIFLAICSFLFLRVLWRFPSQQLKFFLFLFIYLFFQFFIMKIRFSSQISFLKNCFYNSEIVDVTALGNITCTR